MTPPINKTDDLSMDDLQDMNYQVALYGLSQVAVELFHNDALPDDMKEALRDALQETTEYLYKAKKGQERQLFERHRYAVKAAQSFLYNIFRVA